jgi:opacity protein-like surface antigen
MKKIFFAFGVALLSVITTHAQTEKGTLLLGGDVSFNSTDGNSQFVARPNIGVFVANNFAIGGQGYLFTGDGFTSWRVGPFARYYFTQSTKGKPFVGADVSVGGTDDSDTEFGFGARAGYAIFLNQSIALELGVSYERLNEMDGISIGAGFQIHLKRKK